MAEWSGLLPSTDKKKFLILDEMSEPTPEEQVEVDKLLKDMEGAKVIYKKMGEDFNATD